MLMAAAPPAAQQQSREAALDAVRHQAIAAAREAQERERAIAQAQHQIELRAQDAAGRERDIQDSRPEQARFLTALEFLARNARNPFAAADRPALDRQRGKLLVDAAAPALRAEARALAGEIGRIAALRTEIAASRRNLAEMTAALSPDRERLAQLVARRGELIRELLPDGAGGPPAAAVAPAPATLDALIEAADAAAQRRARLLAARLGGVSHGGVTHGGGKAGQPPDAADPTRPGELHAFDPPQSALVAPASGRIARRFGDPGGTEAASQGIGFATPRSAVVVAPFDGRIVYAGAFRDRGLVLIIRHGGLYHSTLAGLGRIDASVGQWVLAGEPVGAMPATAAEGSAEMLDFEVRRGGRPVDPQPWLAKDDLSRADDDGDKRVRQ